MGEAKGRRVRPIAARGTGTETRGGGSARRPPGGVMIIEAVGHGSGVARDRPEADRRREEERAAFAAAVADWRKGSGPVVIEREC